VYTRSWPATADTRFKSVLGWPAYESPSPSPRPTSIGPRLRLNAQSAFEIESAPVTRSSKRKMKRWLIALVSCPPPHTHTSTHPATNPQPPAPSHETSASTPAICRVPVPPPFVFRARNLTPRSMG
jgi:hypothetical protein